MLYAGLLISSTSVATKTAIKRSARKNVRTMVGLANTSFLRTAFIGSIFQIEIGFQKQDILDAPNFKYRRQKLFFLRQVLSNPRLFGINGSCINLCNTKHAL
jgi:hypothetical protein